MTPWSTPALLLLGIVAGPHGLNFLSPAVLLLVDPGIAMALAMLGVFVGLSFDPRQPRMGRLIAASGLRSLTTVLAVGSAAFSASWYWLNPGSPALLIALALGVCASVSDAAADVNIDDVLMSVAGGLVVGALRSAAPGPVLPLTVALVGISIAVAVAAWLLVGQTDVEGEQHVFVVGSLLLIGGAATYLFLSAVLAGLIAGLVWNLAGNLSKPRIMRDLQYFQHPLVVLALLAAGAGAALSIEVVALAAIFVAVRAMSRLIGVRMAERLTEMPVAGENASSLISAGLVGIALALDVFRADGASELGAMLLGAIVVGTIASEAVGLLLPGRGAVA